MQRYLRPDLLEAAGVSDLGDWGAAFTATHTTIEVNATGGGHLVAGHDVGVGRRQGEQVGQVGVLADAGDRAQPGARTACRLPAF
jgi:hydrogenase maturation factor HypE